MLTSTWNYLCTNFNKNPKSKDIEDKYFQFNERFGREDKDVFDKVIRNLCDEEDYFPKISTVLRYLNKVRPANEESFKYCARCKSTGRVSLILAIKKQRDREGNLTGRKGTVHREIWEFNRWREIHADPKMKKFYDCPDTEIVDTSAFCLCEKGQNDYESCGSDGLKLSQQEFRAI